MKSDSIIEIEKQHDIIIEVAKLDNREYITGAEILSSNQIRIINQLNLHIIVSGKHRKNKKRQLKIKEKSK